MSISIVLADDHPILREGLRSLIEREPDMTVVGEAENGRDIVRIAREKRPDVALLDISMPGLNGIDATRQIIAGSPGTRVLCLTMHDARKFIEAMLEAGATGYILKNDVARELAHAIRAVAGGKTFLSPSIATEAVRGLFEMRRASANSVFAELSSRERETLQLIAEGHSSKEIGVRLNLSEKTVIVHRNNLMAKLGIHNIADLTRYAIREGIIDP